MTHNVVDLKGKGRRASEQSKPPNDFWFATVDVRLARIERIMTRLAWQVWVLVCGGAGLFLLELVDALKPS